MPNESLMPSPSLARLIGILEQMLQCIRSRMTPSAPGTADPVTAVTPIENQRRHVEWLCDHDVRAFRVYTREDLLDTRIVPLSEIPSSIFWGQQDRFRDTLYHGTQPFIFYIPTSVAHIMFEEAIGGQHSFVLQLSPIALQDILALDILCQFINPTDFTFPRSIVVSCTFPRDIDVAIPDIAYGTSMQTVRWSDIAVNDYILAELSINRVFGVNGMWAMNYRLLGATRIATLA